MTQKTIKEVVKEFKEAFGMVEFKATNIETGQVGGSKHWKQSPAPRLEITGVDYIALGQLKAGSVPPADGVIAGILKLSIGTR